MAAELHAQVTGVLSKLSTFGRRVDAEVLNALDQVAALIANDAKQGHPRPPAHLLEEYSPSKVDYLRVGNTGEFSSTYRFLTRTGVTRNSILPIKAKKVISGFEAKVVSGQAHSNDLEFGTGITRAFPFMRPALAINRPELIRRVSLAVKRGVEG